ncbi:hypothetical protein KGO95_02005 [Patescibacteria group bacterium]|nr:hypothetical protein [Patescibacteria group bacterium]
MDHLFTKLKTIEPAREFQARSKMLILSEAQQPRRFAVPQFFSSMLRSSVTFALSAAMLFLLVSGLSLLNKQVISPAVASALDAQSLTREMSSFNIQIQIAKVKYYDASAQQLQVALGETSQTIHTNALDETQLHTSSYDPSL